MPVYWFALSQVIELNANRALLIFVILHGLVYPSSNGYNSYMDRDTGPVGGIKNPPLPSRELFYLTIFMDLLALLLSAFISIYFLLGILAFILASRAYSYRGIRIKKYPVLGYLIVILFQGAVIYLLVRHGASEGKTLSLPVIPMLASSLLIGGFYPLTQIYQHEQDKADGIQTISYLLGYRGTFVFTAIIYLLAMSVLGFYFANNLELDRFFLIVNFMLPVLVYFFWWFYQVYKDPVKASYANTMRMNIIASTCTNAAFITLFLIEHV